MARKAKGGGGGGAKGLSADISAKNVIFCWRAPFSMYHIPTLKLFSTVKHNNSKSASKYNFLTLTDNNKACLSSRRFYRSDHKKNTFF